MASQCLHSQMPEAFRLTLMWWQVGHSNFDLSIFSMSLVSFLMTTPYLAPNLPALPAFTVLFAIDFTLSVFSSRCLVCWEVSIIVLDLIHGERSA